MPAEVTEEDILNEFYSNFCLTASFQGRLSYLLMSIHAVNPWIWQRFSDYDPKEILFANMIYGTTIYIYSRPAMLTISIVNRLQFSILGSMMFNYSAMQFYNYLVNKFSSRLYLLTLLGYLSGRIMMVHLLAYLYHVDSRTILSAQERNEMRNSAFESMYV